MMGCIYGMGGMGAWMLVTGLVSIGVLVALVLSVIWFVRYCTSPTQPHSDTAETELRRRYAAGELDHDEYQQRLTTLRHGTQSF
jgi:putative membrane protein